MEIESPDLPSVIGRTLAPMNQAPPELVDERNFILVQLFDDAWLLGAQDEDFLAGANLAYVNGELLQFGNSEAIAPGTYRLSRLVRGKHGTVAPLQHPIGSDFILITSNRVAELAVNYESMKSVITARATAIDGTNVAATLEFEGRSTLPLSPVHPSHEWLGDDLRLTWIRRSRMGANWLDSVDCPLGESMERYTLELTDQQGARLQFETSSPHLHLETSGLGALGLRPWQAAISQVGDFGVSNPCFHVIS